MSVESSVGRVKTVTSSACVKEEESGGLRKPRAGFKERLTTVQHRVRPEGMGHDGDQPPQKSVDFRMESTDLDIVLYLYQFCSRIVQ